MSRTLQPEGRIAHYRVIGPLGASGMGEGYLGQDETLGRSVALKVLPPSQVRSEERVRRFVTEAKSASSLNHPNVVTIHEIGQAPVVPSRRIASSSWVRVDYGVDKSRSVNLARGFRTGEGTEAVGRNDPCPCGSGKKHKHCCLGRAREEDAPALRMRAVQTGLEERILRFAPTKFEKTELEGAGEDFTPEETSDPEYPMAAVKTRDGRELVEALVIEAERLEQSKPPHQPRYDFAKRGGGSALRGRSPRPGEAGRTGTQAPARGGRTSDPRAARSHGGRYPGPVPSPPPPSRTAAAAALGSR